VEISRNFCGDFEELFEEPLWIFFLDTAVVVKKRELLHFVEKNR